MAQPSRNSWAPNEPRTCSGCGQRVTLEQSSMSSSLPTPRVWHMECLPIRVRVVVEEVQRAAA